MGFYNKETFFSNNDFLTPALINEGLSASATFYIETARGIDILSSAELLSPRRQMVQGAPRQIPPVRHIYKGPRRKIRIDIILLLQSSFDISVGRGGGGLFP